MIDIQSAPDHVAAFRITGTLRPEDYDRMIPALENKLRHHEQIGVLADLTDLQRLTAEAVDRDIDYAMSKIGELHRFKRAAVISDEAWVESATQMASSLFPGVDVRVFSSRQKDDAMTWVAA